MQGRAATMRDVSSDEGIAAFVAARLDEEHARAEAMEHFIVYDDTYYSCPATRTEPHGDLEWGEEHCTCQLAARKAKRLREIAAGRAVLAEYQKSVRSVGEGLSVPARRLTLAVAAIWNDHPDYRPEWKPVTAAEPPPP
jgi:Family of unknown function (DUF6221)